MGEAFIHQVRPRQTKLTTIRTGARSWIVHHDLAVANFWSNVQLENRPIHAYCFKRLRKPHLLQVEIGRNHPKRDPCFIRIFKDKMASKVLWVHDIEQSQPIRLPPTPLELTYFGRKAAFFVAILNRQFSDDVVVEVIVYVYLVVWGTELPRFQITILRTVFETSAGERRATQ